LRDIGLMTPDLMRPELYGIADWIRRDFELDVVPVPPEIARALARLSEAEKTRAHLSFARQGEQEMDREHIHMTNPPHEM
jgi:hypothetical protein